MVTSREPVAFSCPAASTPWTNRWFYPLSRRRTPGLPCVFTREPRGRACAHLSRRASPREARRRSPAEPAAGRKASDHRCGLLHRREAVAGPVHPHALARLASFEEFVRLIYPAELSVNRGW